MRSAVLALVITLVDALLGAPAMAHDFYDKACCANHDCHPVACETITAVPQGFDYVDPRDHAVYFFTRDKMLPSADDRCHVCLHGEWMPQPAPVCLYLPIKAWRKTAPLGLFIHCVQGCTAAAQALSEAQRYTTNLITLHGPDGQVIALNPLEVITVRTPRGEVQQHFPKNTTCVVHTADGKFIAVQEDCATVRRRVETEKGDE